MRFEEVHITSPSDPQEGTPTVGPHADNDPIQERTPRSESLDIGVITCVQFGRRVYTL
jgi:hypothetical protein